MKVTDFEKTGIQNRSKIFEKFVMDYIDKNTVCLAHKDKSNSSEPININQDIINDLRGASIKTIKFKNDICLDVIGSELDLRGLEIDIKAFNCKIDGKNAVDSFVIKNGSLKVRTLRLSTRHNKVRFSNLHIDTSSNLGSIRCDGVFPKIDSKCDIISYSISITVEKEDFDIELPRSIWSPEKCKEISGKLGIDNSNIDFAGAYIHLPQGVRAFLQSGEEIWC